MTSWGVNSLDLFVLGTNSAAFHKAWNGASWLPSTTGWESIGGAFVEEPVAISWGTERLDIFGIGTDHALYHKYTESWDGTQWQWGPDQLDWDNLGGDWTQRPSVVSWGPGRLDVFLVGTDNSLYQKFYNGSAWNDGFFGLGGTVKYPPSVVS